MPSMCLSGLCICRGDTEAKREAVAEAMRAANPAEINIDDDDDDDEESGEEVDGK